MIIKLGDIEIYGYDKTDENQRHLKYTLDHDESFRKYVTKHIEERLQETNLGGGLQFNSSYLVKYKEEFVGYIRLEDLRWDGTLNIECAISPAFRNQHLGKKIMEELSNYLLKEYEEIKKLRGIIEKSNYASRNMAMQLGYSVEKQDDMYIYVSKSR